MLGSDVDLQRFIDAQDAPAGGVTVYARALAELRAGAKRSHWMWFVFPQLAGLGESSIAKKFAIQSLEEARAYLAHPILGPRLHATVAALNALEGRSAHDIFGYPDDVKLKSCLTLFSHAAEDNTGFLAALGKYYGGDGDLASIQILGGQD